MATKPIPEVIKPAEEAQALAIPLFCPNDGSILENGTRFGYAAWVCPMCSYWKIKLA